MELSSFKGKDETVDISPYVECIDFYRAKTPERVEYILKDRREMIEVFEDALKYDMLFFTDAPSEVLYNAQGKCFTMKDGLHRSHFLIDKGYKEVPVIVTRTDFELWQKAQYLPFLVHFWCDCQHSL